MQVQFEQYGYEQIAFNVFVDIMLLFYLTGKINLRIAIMNGP